VDYCVAHHIRLSKAVFAVPFYGLINNPQFDAVNRTFFINERKLEHFRGLCADVVCLFSDNDPYVPRQMCERFASLTGGRVQVVPGGGHLNSEAGFREFPLLLTL
jgi:predicted alpha/beta hydrolase family esterase